MLTFHLIVERRESKYRWVWVRTVKRGTIEEAEVWVRDMAREGERYRVRSPVGAWPYSILQEIDVFNVVRLDVLSDEQLSDMLRHWQSWVSWYGDRQSVMPSHRPVPSRHDASKAVKAIKKEMNRRGC